MANFHFLLVLLVISILFKVNHTQESANYFGTLIGSFSRYAHGLSGDVYAIDSTTLWIRDFNYDGAGPDAFFWAGTTGTSAHSGGEIIPDETGSTDILDGYTNANIIINLPDSRVITDYKWISVWCRLYTSNFGEVDIPSDFVAPSSHSLGVLGFTPRVHYVRADDVIILDTQTLRFINLDYDGTGPAAYFWVGSGSTPRSTGYRIPDETGSETKIKGYNGADITITLPGDLTVFDIGYISLWCEAFFQDFGHVDIPDRSELSVPPRISEIQQVMPSPSPSPTTVPSLDNCEQLSDDFQVHWQVRGLSIDFELKGRIETDNYMAFGLSGSSTRTSMVGSDVIVAWFDGTEGQAVDYNINAYAQCSGGFGACPDTLSSNRGVNSVTDVQGSVEDGVTTIAFTRLLDTGDSSDSVIPTDSTVYISWALGRINPDGLAVKHAIRTPTSGNSNGMTINFGRSPSNTCASLVLEGTPKPPPEPWAPNKIAATTTEFDIKIGPSGGERGYTAITGKAGWGIALYVNGLLIPELTVQRGTSYTFRVFGGADASLPAAYHPVYITNDDAGGLASLISDEIKDDLEIYAGPVNGSLCEYVIRGVDQSETINTFDEYFQTLTEECVTPIQPSVFVWTPDENTPDLVYYQCYTHRYLGWKIHVEDQVRNTEQPPATKAEGDDNTTTGSSHRLSPSPSPTTVSSLDNCEQLSDDFQVHWQIRGLSIDFELKGRVETDNYMAFGLSGSPTRTSMVGSDVTVAWFDGTEGQAVDYYIDGYAQCSGGFGACPDTLSSNRGVNSVTDVQGSVEDGVTTIAFTRLLDTGDSLDSVIPTGSSVYISWALGRINPDGLAVKHATRTPTSGNSNGMTINFGRSPSNTCASLVSEGTAKPPPEPWAPNKIAATTTEFDIKIGPSGGEKGYTAITGKPGWGIALYVNGQLIPELTVKRGTSYTFRVFGGADASIPAAYHPVYITNDDARGLGSLVPDDIKEDLEIYAGPVNGSLCEYVIMGVDQSETFNTFGEYFQTLTETCVTPIQPSVFVWTPDKNTPDLVYYQCYTHRYLGWKIHVKDQQPPATDGDGNTTKGSSHRVHTIPAMLLLIISIVCILFV